MSATVNGGGPVNIPTFDQFKEKTIEKANSQLPAQGQYDNGDISETSYSSEGKDVTPAQEKSMWETYKNMLGKLFGGGGSEATSSASAPSGITSGGKSDFDPSKMTKDELIAANSRQSELTPEQNKELTEEINKRAIAKMPGRSTEELQGLLKTNLTPEVRAAIEELLAKRGEPIEPGVGGASTRAENRPGVGGATARMELDEAKKAPEGITSNGKNEFDPKSMTREEIKAANARQDELSPLQNEQLTNEITQRSIAGLPNKTNDELQTLLETPQLRAVAKAIESELQNRGIEPNTNATKEAYEANGIGNEY